MRSLRTIGYAATFGSALALLAGTTSFAASPEVQGHRGARARFPENTWPAFDHAISVGADVLELDVGISRDGRVVISHDEFVNGQHCLGPNGAKLPDRGGWIFMQTFAQLQQYDCGSIKNPQFPKQQTVPGTRYLALDELFERIKKDPRPQAARVRFNIETKTSPELPAGATLSPEAFVRILLGVIKTHGMMDRVLLQSFDYRTLVEARKLEPTLKLSALTNDFWARKLKIVDELKPDVLSPLYHYLASGETEAIHAHGAKVIPWTVNDPKAWQRMLDKGVDGIITDDPEALIQFLKSRGVRK